MVDIARPSSVVKKKKIRRTIYATAAAVVVLLITFGVSQLKPAAPSVDRAAVWIDTVKRGPMLRLVRGSGTLVPEEIRWINTTTSGRVERIVLRPGATVAPGTVILELSNPELQQSVKEGAAGVCSPRRPTSTTARPSSKAAFCTQQAERRRCEVPVRRRRAPARSAREAVQGRPHLGDPGQAIRARAKRN